MGDSKGSAITLYHGSRVRVPRPQYGIGSPYNDYGLGFYCTEYVDLAREWACPDLSDGFVNKYLLDMGGLSLIDLDSEDFGSLNWLAVLLENRKFDVSTPVMKRAKGFMMERYAVDLSAADVVMGYRADDSYFSFARAFLDNRISLRQLEEALRFGKLGRQVALKSPKAFEAVSFIESFPVDGSIWYSRRALRDKKARADYREMVDSGDVRSDDIFMIDLLRGDGR